jgi:hypothetical protein
MPDRSRVMTQTKRDTLVLQVGGLAWGSTPHSKNVLLRKSNKGIRWMDITMVTDRKKKWKDIAGQAKAHSRL